MASLRTVSQILLVVMKQLREDEQELLVSEMRGISLQEDCPLSANKAFETYIHTYIHTREGKNMHRTSASG